MDTSDCVDQNDVLARASELAEQQDVAVIFTVDAYACRLCGAFVESGAGICDPCHERENKPMNKPYKASMWNPGGRSRDVSKRVVVPVWDRTKK